MFSSVFVFLNFADFEKSTTIHIAEFLALLKATSMQI